ncbi:hypothetical protein MMC25_006367 [Agyrium rufum]|nr:hypothetical protein [Agyrium rufum]
MLDENLPTLYLKPSADNVKHDATIYLSQYGVEASPLYTLRHPDPFLEGSRNRYAVALCDSYNQDVLFGEVLLVPEWTKPNPTAEELRLSGGIPSPPQPILPTEFTIQLYNPDQQVTVRQHSGSWGASSYWEFEMPSQTFRVPSISALDRTQSDPTASETTPHVMFRWKRDGKLSKDLSCSLSGKSTNPDGTKRKHKEPDIAISFFRHLKEITIYEPNLSRVEMEDPKGLEVVLLLCATVLRDVYFSPLNQAFNIVDLPKPTSRRRGSNNRSPAPIVNGRTPTSASLSSPHVAATTTLTTSTTSSSSRPSFPASSSFSTAATPQSSSSSHLPPTDPRSQWEIDAETARLRKHQEREALERHRAEEAETKRVKAMLEAEEKERRRKAAEVEKETERLRKVYGVRGNSIPEEGGDGGGGGSRPALPARRTVGQSSGRSSSVGVPVQNQNQNQRWDQRHGAPGVAVVPDGYLSHPQSQSYSHPQAYGQPIDNSVYGSGFGSGAGSGSGIGSGGDGGAPINGYASSPYLQAPGDVAASSSTFSGGENGGGGGRLSSNGSGSGFGNRIRNRNGIGGGRLKPKSSFFGLGRGDGFGKLVKKQSSIF